AAAGAAARRRPAPARRGQARDAGSTRARLVTIGTAGYDVPVAIAATTRSFTADEDVHRLSTEEYERIVKTGALEDLRVELLDGLLVDMSPHDEPHVHAIRQLMLMCRARLDLLRIQMPLAVGEGWVPEPDVALVDHEDRNVRPTTALFVAEVALSSHARDATKVLGY